MVYVPKTSAKFRAGINDAVYPLMDDNGADPMRLKGRGVGTNPFSTGIVNFGSGMQVHAAKWPAQLSLA